MQGLRGEMWAYYTTLTQRHYQHKPSADIQMMTQLILFLKHNS